MTALVWLTRDLRLHDHPALRTALGVATAVVAVPPNTFDRTEFKARRVVDERDLHAAK